jgi:hypothetical protein
VTTSGGFDVASFHRRGFATIERVLDDAVVVEMRSRVWAQLADQGIVRDDPASWPTGSVAGLREVRRGDPCPTDAPAVRDVVEDLFGAVPWKPPTHWGQVLVAFPEPGAWPLPRSGWHCDYPFWFAPDEVWGAVVFLFLDGVEPHGGSTLALEGSPELIRRHVAGRDDLATEKPTAVLDELWSRHDELMTTDERVLLDDGVRIDDVDLRVVELTGRAGDGVVCHPWLLHRASPNTSERPRLQRAARFQRRFRLDP